ncbi:helix-turn-helix transcriptional regulator [Shimia aestuarii]|uniref:helix-turn-helix transcriptional regulator n=1 Tax=Shimia aestuarii TaxID=254406 RepID=UPI001FB32A68|nr:helix-turn-helix domain-containing protein [Shimia aestuarii]
MSKTLIAVDEDRLDRIEAQQKAILAALQGARVQPAPEWVSITEAKAILGVSKSTIYRKIEDGEIEVKGRGKTRKVRIG